MSKKRRTAKPPVRVPDDDDTYWMWSRFHALRGEWGKQLATRIAIDRDIKLYGFLRDKTRRVLYPIY